MAKAGDETDISNASRKENQRGSAAERQLRRIQARQRLESALADLARIKGKASDDGNHAASLSEVCAEAHGTSESEEEGGEAQDS